MDTIYQKLTNYATKESFSELQEKVIPPVKSFQEQLLEYRDQNLQHREIIRRFDDILLTKASKVELKAFEDEIRIKYVDKKEFADFARNNTDKFDEHYDYLIKLEDTLDTLNKEVNKEVS